MNERITKREINSFKGIAKRLENSLKNIERSGVSDNDMARHGRVSAREAIGSFDPRIVFASWTVDGEKTNAMLLDFDAQEGWNWLLTGEWKYIKVSSGKQDKEADDREVIELNKKIPDRLRTEIWFSETQDRRVRELYEEKVAA